MRIDLDTALVRSRAWATKVMENYFGVAEEETPQSPLVNIGGQNAIDANSSSGLRATAGVGQGENSREVTDLADPVISPD